MEWKHKKRNKYDIVLGNMRHYLRANSGGIFLRMCCCPPPSEHTTNSNSNREQKKIYKKHIEDVHMNVLFADDMAVISFETKVMANVFFSLSLSRSPDAIAIVNNSVKQCLCNAIGSSQSTR